MNIKELKILIENIPDDMDIFIRKENDDFIYEMANSAVIIPIRFKADGIKKSEQPTVDCFVISDLN